MEDYYNILNIKPGAGNFKIATSYKKRISGLINNSEASFDTEIFIKVNQAYFVLGNEQGRKYYDMLYQCVITNTQFLNANTKLMYLEIIEELAENGKLKAESLAGNLDNLKESDFVKPLLLSFLLQGFFKSPGSELMISGFGGLIYILISFSLFLKEIKHFEPGYFTAMLFLASFGAILIISRYRTFVVSKFREEMDCSA